MLNVNGKIIFTNGYTEAPALRRPISTKESWKARSPLFYFIQKNSVLVKVGGGEAKIKKQKTQELWDVLGKNKRSMSEVLHLPGRRRGRRAPKPFNSKVCRPTPRNPVAASQPASAGDELR